jgi:mxaJ protein
MRDLNLPPSFIVDDLMKGGVNIPFCGARCQLGRAGVLVSWWWYPHQNTSRKMHGKRAGGTVSVGVRKKDKDRIVMINDALERNKVEIEKIMDEFDLHTSRWSMKRRVDSRKRETTR